MANSTPSPTQELSAAKRELLAQRLKGLARSAAPRERVQPRPAGTPVRISVDQYRIWLHHFMHPGSPTYNEPITLTHRGPLDPVLVQRSLELYASRHEAWRTSFREGDGIIWQQVEPSVAIPVSLHNLSALPAAERESADKRLATDQAVKPFDLRLAPMVRALLTRHTPEEDRLHLVIHHVIFDGAAIRDSFVPEFAEIYAALAADREPQLAPRELQYPDYALWREQQLGSGALQPSLEFWREELGGDVSVLRLPTDHPRPAVTSHRGAMEMFSIPPALTSALRSISQQHGATLYMLLLAALQALQFRYSGQDDVIIGTGANGRRLPELRGMMGYMLDTFPVRSRLRPQQTFLDLLHDVKATLLRCLGPAEVPFDHIVKACGVRSDPSFHPVFQTFFSFLPPLEPRTDSWQLQPKMVDAGSAKFDIYVEAEERDNDVAACILYNTDLFERSTIQRMIGHWTTMLEAISLAPETAIERLPLLAQAERDLMLHRWNRTEAAVPETTMHGLFEDQASRTPDRIAVEFESTRLTYAELNDRAECFAAILLQAGAARGKLVALCIDRSENLLAALLGILKTGATYLPLDPGAPLSRITLCLEDAEPSILLTERSLLDKLPAGNATVLAIDDLVERARSLPHGTRVPRDASGPDDSAYIIHTSGSTGRPKAVELGHRGVVNLLLSMQRQPGMTSDDILVAVTTISFDIAVLELFLPVITGARVVIARRTTALDPFELSDLIESSGCTVVQATPATWRALMAIDWPGKQGLKVLCGGEALTRDLGEKLLERDVELWNVYGPTETTIWSTARRVRRKQGIVPVGKPIANTTTYILDRNQLPVPIGVTGELYIGGMGLAKGYRGQPELTAQKFLALDAANGERVYRTGDYAVYREDGTIECQGRADNQVKVRGYRIELEEVELHLSAHPDVAAAAATVWQDEAVGNRLAGYVVGKGGQKPEARDLRRFLQPRLPEYMIPTEFVVLDAMPLTPNGKTDRKALPEATRTASAPGDASDHPVTPEEVRLARIWSEVLSAPQVRRTDNFFDLGGHSLLLVILFSRINKEFGTALPITSIFDAQKLFELARLLERPPELSSLVRVQTAGSRAPLFLAHSYLLYRALSTALGNEQPFYGLRELETDGDLGIVERAQRYVQEMRSVQPHGPYQIAGWCAAGPLAAEIARQTILAGEEVSVLLLFDAWMPGYAESVEAQNGGGSLLARVRRKAKHYATVARNMKPLDILQSAWRFPRRAFKDARDEFYIRNWARVKAICERWHIELPQFMHNTSLQTFASLRQFEPGPLPLRITLIRASLTRRIPGGAESCGWEAVAQKGVQTLWAPGDHETMFRGANLAMTAQLVADALAQANTTESAPEAASRQETLNALPS